MKKFFTNILMGLIPFVVVTIFIALCMGLAYIFALTPAYVLYIFVGILFIVILYIIGNWLRTKW